MPIDVLAGKFNKAVKPVVSDIQSSQSVKDTLATASLLANHQREAQIQEAKVKAQEAEIAELKRQAAEANARIERETIKSAIIAAANKPELRALNVEHVYNLRAGDFIIHNGKVVLKSDPSKGVEVAIPEFLGGEGKYMCAPVVPGGGSGAPGLPNVNPQTPPPDLKTNEGLTRVTRGLTYDLLGATPKPMTGAAQTTPPVK